LRSNVICAIGDFAGGLSIPPQELHSQGIPAAPHWQAFAYFEGAGAARGGEPDDEG
jgi:hypothetical protein